MAETPDSQPAPPHGPAPLQPDDTVVVRIGDPASDLARALQASRRLRALRTARLPLQRDQVYVVPAGKKLSILDDHIDVWTLGGLEARMDERTRELAAANEALRREVDERARSEQARLHLLRVLVNAQEQERARISRELHDQLGQEVSALGLKLAAIKAMNGVPRALREELASLQQVVEKIDSDVEFLVWELRPTGLDDLGLAEALSDYVAAWSKYFGVRAELRSSLVERLPGETENVFYRIAQEALNNIMKHAKASSVYLELQRGPSEASLTIADDGVGFDPARVDAHSLGLVGMRERAALVGGTTQFRSHPGGGTTVIVRVPA